MAFPGSSFVARSVQRYDSMIKWKIHFIINGVIAIPVVLLICSILATPTGGGFFPGLSGVVALLLAGAGLAYFAITTLLHFVWSKACGSGQRRALFVAGEAFIYLLPVFLAAIPFVHVNFIEPRQREAARARLSRVLEIVSFDEGPVRNHQGDIRGIRVTLALKVRSAGTYVIRPPFLTGGTKGGYSFRARSETSGGTKHRFDENETKVFEYELEPAAYGRHDHPLPVVPLGSFPFTLHWVVGEWQGASITLDGHTDPRLRTRAYNQAEFVVKARSAEPRRQRKLPQTRRSEELDRAVAECVAVDAVRYLLLGAKRGQESEVAPTPTISVLLKRCSIALAFEVFVTFNETELRIGSVKVGKAPGDGLSSQFWITSHEALPDLVNVVLRSSAEVGCGLGEIWDGKLRFSNVEVITHDRWEARLKQGYPRYRPEVVLPATPESMTEPKENQQLRTGD